jgi:predicted MFS family arabinose efflux permease
MSEQTTSYVLTYVGISIVLVQGVAIGKLIASFSETRLIFSGVVLLAVALLVPVVIPLPLAGGVINTVTNNSITTSVYSQELGGELGPAPALAGREQDKMSTEVQN